MTAQNVFSEFKEIRVSDIQMGDKKPVRIKRVTEPNTNQKKILDDLGICGVKKLKSESCL
ncbi:MAG: hypothetical protein COS36_01175 [Candidatus Altarchaeum sp. CG03_land_8_20_14_0_80_32_618]|nr:MAG: hypothetical protein AUK59_03770 [Candidatus Altarchaeum sp. CG2_30_32_3053]PIV28734.1 MAG: hypothetical protein COS36_01175 [Candidatus Altarchaeum sp. CG03_land_8_20_14_0_80_32_618]PIZ30075.1 MAG: hypothetical protein COY41_04635 [Candidatus Altarchaeum sp. CG_4_10_14_0_8_um_filter_32_851]